MRHSPVLSAALAAFISLSPALAHPTQSDCDTPDPSKVILRDVAIIGAGSSGTNAAIGLKDAGKSVIVIESQEHAGGHTNTYTDKATGQSVDYGVVVFHNTTTVNNYFGRFKIPLAPISLTGPQSVDFDFSTGNAVQAAQYSTQAVQAAIQKYAGFLSKYPKLAGGMFLPNPVPEELVMPFGRLVKKLGLEAMVPIVSQYNGGFGDVMSVPVVENARVIGLELLQAIASNGLITSARHNNSALYAAAEAELRAAKSILLSSTVIQSTRSKSGVDLVVKTPSGIKHIRAKKLLITIPPRLSNLQAFNPTKAETAVFSKWLNTGYWNMLVENTGFPLGLQANNRGQGTPYNLPKLPGAYLVGPTVIPGVYSTYYATDRSTNEYPLDTETVKSRVIAEIKRIQAVNQKGMNFTITEPKILIAKSHTPFYCQATASDIKAGFYNSLYALQGQESTFWTGAAWRAHDSSAIWDFNKNVVLPMILKSL
ncbi:hypothetical protein ACJQWK_09560 [Exserohilum turcicum]|uniref:Amine oxidase domain-containing protein n=1 Tax=Exserohilum turcicum (strain 28A) TaxID=671987 RepID=R0KNA5_EXST2|nr:uncharacterized protein SETTUDRAFT_105174 [Exserohilum turcica Et28A]EOA89402.1 hypothetical protein SETTUDRAFT_105174 [Exserohilum turcica Et28A]